MSASLRTEDLKKVYRSAPPMAAQRGFMFAGPSGKSRGDKKSVEPGALLRRERRALRQQ